MTTLQEVLDALPSNPDVIAEFLVEQDCAGSRGDGACCPVANYLKGEGFVGVFVETGYVKGSIDGEEFFIPTPDAIASFVRQFDEDEEWPELDIDAEDVTE